MKYYNIYEISNCMNTRIAFRGRSRLHDYFTLNLFIVQDNLPMRDKLVSVTKLVPEPSLSKPAVEKQEPIHVIVLQGHKADVNSY